MSENRTTTNISAVEIFSSSSNEISPSDKYGDVYIAYCCLVVPIAVVLWRNRSRQLAGSVMEPQSDPQPPNTAVNTKT
jgi:hypothetical protein